jgi:hypothetical protein
VSNQPTEQPGTAEYPPIDLATLGPVKRSRGGKVMLDTYNRLPSRFITLEEAKARGLEHFFIGASCRYGHVAPRYTSNPDQCVDCARARRGKALIGGSSRRQSFYKERKPAAAPAAAPIVIAAPAEPTVDQTDKVFLAAYAEFRDLARAADAAGATAAGIEARRSHSAALDKAMTALEARLDIRRALPAPGEFEWTAEKERKLCTLYIDSGDIATARDSIGCTPSQYYQHRATSRAFDSMLEEAEPLANKALEERATQLALQGNDKLLQKLLAARIPQVYSERLAVDLHVSRLDNLTDDQLRQRIAQLRRSQDVIIEGEIVQQDPDSITKYV